MLICHRVYHIGQDMNSGNADDIGCWSPLICIWLRMPKRLPPSLDCFTSPSFMDSAAPIPDTVEPTLICIVTCRKKRVWQQDLFM